MCVWPRLASISVILLGLLQAGCRGDDVPDPSSDGSGDGDSGGNGDGDGSMIPGPLGSGGGSGEGGDDGYDKDSHVAVLWLTTTPFLHPDEIGDEDVAGSVRVVEDHDGLHQDPEAFATMPAALETDMTIHVRGNSSSSFEKKGYALEFQGATDQIKLPLLGMPKESDWVLHGPYSDKTYLRNALAYWLGREIYRGPDGKIEAGRWNPRTRFTELYINGHYWGVYLVVEKTKADADRVDVDRPAESALLGDVSGGYIVRREGGGNAWEGRDWVSSVDQTVYTHHYPRIEDITPDQSEYIHDYFNEFEEMMSGPTYDDPASGYPAYIDVTSWVDYFLATEMSNNVDGYFKSVYFVKQSDLLGGKLSLSPWWDFNIAFGNADYRDGNNVQNWVYDTPGTEPAEYSPPGDTPFLTNYFKRLWADPAFLETMVCRWQTLRTGPLSTTVIHTRIDAWKSQLANAEERDHERWPVLGQYLWPNPVVYDTYEEEVNALKTFIEARFSFLDENLPELAPGITCP